MLRSSVQTVINIIVIVLLVGQLALAAVAFIPSHNPVGPLLGKVLSAKGNLSSMLSNLDPVALAEALRNNPEMLTDLFEELGADNARKIAEAVNENPDFAVIFVANLDPATLAFMINNPDTAEFTVELMKYLDPVIIARVLNENGLFLTNLLGELDAQVIAGALNQNGAFLAATTAAMDTAVLAKAVNENGAFMSGLISFLDPAVIGGALNANPAVVGDLMGFLDTAVVAGIINENEDFLVGLMGSLDPAVLTAGMNEHPTFLSRLMSNLNPVVIAGVLNRNADSNIDLVNNLSDQLLTAVIAATAGNQSFLDSLIKKLDPAVAAAAANASPTFTAGLIKALDPAWVARIANAHPKLVFQVMDAIDPDLVATMLNNGSLTARVLPLIDTAAIGAALGEHTDLVTRLIPLLDPALAEVTNRALEGNPGLVSTLLAHLDGAQIASALSQAPSFITGLTSSLSGGMVGAALRGSNANPDFMINLTNALSPQAVSAAVDLSGAFIPNLLAMLPPNIAVAAAQGINANPAMLDAVLSTSDPRVLAGILNSGAADRLIADLIPLLSPQVAQAIAEAINIDAEEIVGNSMVKSLMLASNPDVISDAINRNPGFVSGVLSRLNATAAKAIADGMNADVAAHPANNATLIIASTLNGKTGEAIALALSANPGIMEPLLKNLDPQVGKAIAEGLNNSVYPDFNTQLMTNLDASLGYYIAQGLDQNPALAPLMSALVGNLNTDTSAEIAAGLNKNALEGHGFLAATLGATGVNTSVALINAVNALPNDPALPDNGNFLYGIITRLDTTTAADVANALDANPDLVKNILRYLDGQKAAEALNDNEPFLTSLMANLNGAALAGALNNALANPGGQAFLINLLANLETDSLANALNANQDLTAQLLDQAAINGLGATVAQAMVNAGVGGPVGFLTELLSTLSADTMKEALNLSLANQDVDLPIVHDVAHDGFTGPHGHNMLECVWFDLLSRLAIGGFPLMYLPMYLNFYEFEKAP